MGIEPSSCPRSEEISGENQRNQEVIWCPRSAPGVPQVQWHDFMIRKG